MKLLDVPVIDMNPFLTGDAEARAKVAKKVDRACRDIGFLVINGHGVDPALIERTREISRQFFDLPAERKLSVAKPQPGVLRGYLGVAGESIGRSRDLNAKAGDLNESMQIGPIDVPPDDYAFAPAAGRHFAPNLWPDEPVEFQKIWTEYYEAMSELANELMRAFALALGEEESYFEDKLDRHISRLRVRNYPATDNPAEPGQIRAGAHTDWGSLTILATEDAPGGLQVRNAEGEWRDVPILPGCFIVNIGDLMARWTNDEWVSTLHRVVNPPAEQASTSRRQSLIFFHNPNYDAVIECIPSCLPEGAAPKYPTTTSGEHLLEMFVRSQNDN
ncbi:2-oxoglutarate and iron-dependent oxygenase domain-containing protein [Amycolatopsis sp. NPDC047767]|uniref:isopenicillin N synthase family dioxygenase n=1 Tax=Amycolatopsis sp. NPDC047767 TaxID=3156765 RepID=UPI0034516D27